MEHQNPIWDRENGTSMTIKAHIPTDDIGPLWDEMDKDEKTEVKLMEIPSSTQEMKKASHTHTHRVALLMTLEATRALLFWEPVSPRILTARFNSKGKKVTFIQCFAATNVADTGDKMDFSEQLQSVTNKVPKTDMKILLVDLNEKKVDIYNTNSDHIMGIHYTGEQN